MGFSITDQTLTLVFIIAGCIGSGFLSGFLLGVFNISSNYHTFIITSSMVLGLFGGCWFGELLIREQLKGG